jgi:hypothetical protein
MFTLTRNQLRHLHPRLSEKITDPELDEVIVQTTAQVAQWVLEAAACPSPPVAMTAFYQNKLGELDAGLRLVKDRMTAQANVSTSQAEIGPTGTSVTTSRSFGASGLENMYNTLLAERTKLLAKLGISDVPAILPALCKATTKGLLDTDPGIDWTARNDEPSAIENR